MSNADSRGKPPKKAARGAISAPTKNEIKSLVSAEVQSQLDRERTVIKDAGSFALKIIGAAFALLLAVFTVFGLTTWRDVAKETTEYMKQKVDGLVQNTDSETGVKQLLNDLVNHAITDSKLASLQKVKKDPLELSKYEWDRLKMWLKTEELSNEDFSDVLAVLNAQKEDRKKVDANGQLSEMLSPPVGSAYQWMSRQPDKRLAVLSGFLHVDMGTSALKIAQDPNLSEVMSLEAINYIGKIGYVDGFDKLISIATTNNDGGKLVTGALSNAAFTETRRPTIIEAS